MSSRQSTLQPHPAVPTASLSNVPLPTTSFGAQRLLEKQHEWQGVALLKEASQTMLRNVEELAAQGDIMADGGKAIGSVLANWPNVFRIISLCASAQARNTPAGSQEPEPEAPAEAEPLPRLVRLQVAGLQSSDSRPNGA